MGGKPRPPTMSQDQYELMDALWRRPQDAELFYAGDKPTAIFRLLESRKWIIKQIGDGVYYWALTGSGEEALIKLYSESKN